jgi:magnesium transporter
MLEETKKKNFTVVVIKNPTRHDIASLQDRFNLLAENLRSTLPPVQRAQYILETDYEFLVLQFPYYNKSKEEIVASEVDFFLGKNFLVIVTDAKLQPLLEELNTQLQSVSKTGLPATLMLALIERLIGSLSPLLNHISADIDQVEAKILDESKAQRLTIYSLLALKRNVINFRRIIQENEVALGRMRNISRALQSQFLRAKVETLTVLAGEVSNTLQTYAEAIDDLDETHESLLNFRTNQVMKTLTVFAVIVFPLTLLAAIFGMNFQAMPFTSIEHGFWIVIGIMLAGAATLWAYFKYKKWI